MDTDFHDPIAVARAWMTQWCATDYRQPRNNNVERATVYATTAGKTSDLAAGDTTATFLKAIERKLAHRCDQLTAETSRELPSGPDNVIVVLTARRTLLTADQPVQSEHVSTTRAVLRQPDGRWLVDRPLEAIR
ncbi:hypothetical protein FKR81_37460 [Lentzea tibetensis]|uniref:SnoaL-like domain-containing protein n=1 Tax=Lentzea tibetensis TaxID=2591470 RepID=A0A563EHT4_9PSEU|nr:hypothetical protein [Lentzea tibetensis]TWP46058.1 hypothetical protein FKR81_37460 [Lentzea tibetensis]